MSGHGTPQAVDRRLEMQRLTGGRAILATEPQPDAVEIGQLTTALTAELKRAGLATWGGVGSVESVATALWNAGWRHAR